jgi:predicted Zn-dependent protease with MMP-like domain
MTQRFGPAPSLADFEAIARDAFARLPDQFRRLAGHVVFHIEDFADEETLDALGIEDPFELTGLYRGDDPLRRSVLDFATDTPMVFLYRRPILDEWAERGDLSLEALIEHVVVHEIGHHFGLSDDDIDAIEARD